VSEVAGRGDDAPAEVVLLDSVDHHAGGERIGGVGEPRGEFEPAAALFGWRKRPSTEDGGKAARNDFALV